jgi:hypothetical protein
MLLLASALEYVGILVVLNNHIAPWWDPGCLHLGNANLDHSQLVRVFLRNCQKFSRLQLSIDVFEKSRFSFNICRRIAAF